MAEIWHYAFDEKVHTNVLGYQYEVNTDTFQTNCEHLDSPPPHLLQTSHPDEVLTPLNIEVTSSFNNSPAVYIEEFEDPEMYTPSSSHMVLATPMPSPVNMHIKCNDPFFPIIVGAKIMGKPCSCRNKYVDKITKEQRLECFNTFCKLGSRE